MARIDGATRTGEHRGAPRATELFSGLGFGRLFEDIENPAFA